MFHFDLRRIASTSGIPNTTLHVASRFILRRHGGWQWPMPMASRNTSSASFIAKCPIATRSTPNSLIQLANQMTPLTTSREIRLASRPKGIPTAANFALAQITLPRLQAQQVLVRNLFMSVDPYMRGRMNEGKSYVPPFTIGQALEGGAIGEVFHSEAKEFKAGDVVTSRYGWREAFVAAPTDLRAVDNAVQPLSVYLGTLGMTGMTAWAGLTLLNVKAGDVIFISGAAGAVGNMAGQIAKLRGCRVIGSAGTDRKVRSLVDDCGFDAAFNYKAGPMLDQLNRVAPDGIDVYFDNVGGESLEAALSALRIHGRIIACGGISSYNDEKPKPGPANLFNVTTKRLAMKGLIVGDWLDRQSEFDAEVGGYFRAGKLKTLETVVEGIDHAVDAFLGLFSGKNMGKMIVKLT